MTIKLNRSCFIAALSLLGAAWCAAAGAQSLTLSLKLDAVAPAPPQVENVIAPVDRCSGRSWAAWLATTCGDQSFSRSVPPVTAATGATGEVSDAAAAERIVDEGPTYAGENYPVSGLSTLGALSPSRLLRAAREVPVQAGKAVDLLFRFASRYRSRSADDGSEVVKFKDVTSENRTQPSGIKGLGVELLLPFQ